MNVDEDQEQGDQHRHAARDHLRVDQETRNTKHFSHDNTRLKPHLINFGKLCLYQNTGYNAEHG